MFTQSCGPNRVAAFNVAALAATLSLVLCGTGPSTAAITKPATHTVVIEATRFEPEMLTVTTGDTIVWVNKDPFPHTATSKAGGFDSHEIAAGKSWKYTPRKTGVFSYVCTLHPTMKATLQVSTGSR